MGNPVTLAQLRTKIVSKADMVDSLFPNDGTAGNWTTIDGWINEALAALHDMIIGAYENAAVDIFSIIPDGSESYTLPADLHTLLAVKVLENEQRYPVRRVMTGELGAYAGAPGGYYGGVAYDLLGNSIVVVPKSTSVSVIELWYAPQHQDLKNASDKVQYNIPLHWEAYVVNDVAGQLLAKEESDPTEAYTRRDKVAGKIAQHAAQRDAAENKRVIDVINNDGGCGYPFVRGF